MDPTDSIGALMVKEDGAATEANRSGHCMIDDALWWLYAVDGALEVLPVSLYWSEVVGWIVTAIGISHYSHFKPTSLLRNRCEDREN